MARTADRLASTAGRKKANALARFPVSTPRTWDNAMAVFDQMRMRRQSPAAS